MSKKHVLWLYQELPDLVSRGVLTGETAERLRRHYGEAEPINKRRIAFLTFGILGAFLVGSGSILLLGHSWENLSRPVRVFLSLAPLVIAQVLAGWTVWRRWESAAWCESTAVFLMFSIGASITLVGQTYHVPGDFAQLLLIWMLLSAPLIYLLNTSLCAASYLVGITLWACTARMQSQDALLFWILAAVAIPRLWMTARENPYAIRPVLGLWSLALCLCVATGVTMAHALPGLWIIVYSSLFAVFCLAGSIWFLEAPSFWQRPLAAVSAVGIPVLCLMFSFEWPWEEIGWHHYLPPSGYRRWFALYDFVLAAALTTAFIFLLVRSIRKLQMHQPLFGAIAILAVICYFLVAADPRGTAIARVLFNLYLLALGLATVVVGIRNNHLGTVNFGLLILSALIVTRFFDSDLGFVTRGVAFIVVGIGFLTTNLMLLQRTKGGTQ